jgi:predicted ATP-grasp superfamily ATP-dependent carboligase
MDEFLVLQERPTSGETYMIAGWRQWADAGSISSGLPPYLVQHTNARKIGLIKSGDFYLFQLPGTHHLLRPVVKLEEGYRREMRHHRNDIFYTGNSEHGLVIFIGDEPHMKVDEYASTFFSMAKALNVQQIAIVGGVYGMVPYDKDRSVACAYSHPYLRRQLDDYAVGYSNYEGGVSLGTYLLDRAERENVESFVFYAFVPAYDLSQITGQTGGFSIDPDYKAWYDVMRRLNHKFGLGVDLSDLVNRSDQLIANIDHEVEELDRKMPQLNVRQKLEQLGRDFEEKSFMPLDDVWENELGDLFGDEQ